jgi:predicted aldo/keto reductase-like oxidoreductase
MINKFFPEIMGKFGFGCMRLPMINGEVDMPQFCEMVDAFLSSGLNYFDTAHGYLDGKSELALRDGLTSRYPRNKYILTNKLSTHFFTREDQIRPLFEEQLRACGVEYFDFYLMHAQDKANFEKYKKCRAYETALELKKEGKIRHFGISFHDRADVLDRILNEYPQIEAVQIQFNYVDFEDPSVESRKVYETALKHGKPVIVMEPVKGGSLVNLPEEAQQVFDALRGGSNASFALRFAAGFDNMMMVLSGMSTIGQMQENISFMADPEKLNEEETAAVNRVREIFTSLNMIPCTACHYCVLDNDCPKDIRIPELFSCYNLKTTFQSWNQDYYYTINTRGHGKASDCLKCGKCEKICPQHLPIRKLLEQVAGEFEKA